jgi:PAS domain S-box-containing protein
VVAAAVVGAAVVVAAVVVVGAAAAAAAGSPASLNNFESTGAAFLREASAGSFLSVRAHQRHIVVAIGYWTCLIGGFHARLCCVVGVDDVSSGDRPSFDAWALFDVMEESVAIYDRQARIRYVNPTTQRLFGRTRAELEGQVLWELFPEARGNAFFLAFERVLQAGASEVFEHHYPPWDRWFENRIYASGPWLVVIAKDVTEQRLAGAQAEQARRDIAGAADRTLRLQALTTALSGTLNGKDVATTIVEAGRAALGAAASFIWMREHFGRDGGTDHGTDLHMIASDGYAGARLQQFQRLSMDRPGPITAAMRDGQPQLVGSTAELLGRFPGTLDGGPSPFKAWATVPFVLRGQSIGVVVLSFAEERVFSESEQRLLTSMATQAALAFERCHLFEQERAARARAERAADRTQRLQVATTALVMAAGPRQVSRELLNLCVDAVQASWGIIGLVTGDGEAVEILEGVRIDPEPLQGWRHIPLDSHTPLTDAIHSRRPVWIETEDEMETRYPAPGAEGGSPGGRALRAGALAIAPLISGQGVIGAYALGFAGSRTFADEEKDLIVALGHISAQALDRTGREEEVRRALELARVAEKRALDANRAKDEFLAMLGHELRNPLAPILTALELMRLRAPDVSAKERMVVERQVRHMVRLIDDLLDVSRIARGKVALQRSVLEVAEVVAKAVEVAGPLISQRALTLTTDVPSWGLTVAADEERLNQVLGNLLTNAAKYSEPGGAVHVFARSDEDSVVIGVTDSGVGIDAELLPTVFDLFVQGRRSLDRADGGLGLGLTIVRSLVEAHGGTVSAHSEGPGRGSQFVIRLPLAAPEAITPRPSPLPEAMPKGELAATLDGSSGARVLIVDDNEDAATMMAEALGAAGFVTRVEASGPRGLEAAVEFRPQVALLDIGLPGMDGYELCRRLRQTQELGPIKVVAVTGYGQLSDRERALRAGFHQHLVKPVDLSRVRALVRELVLRDAPPRTDVAGP